MNVQEFGRAGRSMGVFSARPTSLLAGLLLLALSALAIQPPSAGASGTSRDPLVPFIVGGQESSSSQFPWQVFVLREAEGIQATCGGSILNATTILTAAHCVDHEGTTNPYPAADFIVVAGDSNVMEVSPTTQVRSLTGVRVHPYFSPLPNIKDDAALLTLKTPLTLSAAAGAQAIEIVAAGQRRLPEPRCR